MTTTTTWVVSIHHPDNAEDPYLYGPFRSQDTAQVFRERVLRLLGPNEGRVGVGVEPVRRTTLTQVRADGWVEVAAGEGQGGWVGTAGRGQ